MMQKHIDNTFYGSLKIVVENENGYSFIDLDSNMDRVFYRYDKNKYIEIPTCKVYGSILDNELLYDGSIVLDTTSLIPLNSVIEKNSLERKKKKK